MQMTTSVMVLDLTNRKLIVSTASITEVFEVPSVIAQGARSLRRVVLRFAAELGSLADFAPGGVTTGDCQVFSSPIPILVVGSYKALSSDGHVQVTPTRIRGGAPKVSVVGALGFGFRPGDSERSNNGLRYFREPKEGYFLPAGTEVRAVPVHGNKNCLTASAVGVGIDILVSMKSDTLYVLEGQSNRERVWSLSFDRPDLTHLRDIKMVPEHRTDIFGGVNPECEEGIAPPHETTSVAA